MRKTYFIHDNGGRPFKVIVTKNVGQDSIVRIFRMKDSRYEKNPILTFDSDRVFVGLSPFNAMTEFSGGYGKYYDGNSLLVHLEGNTYVFIGWEIYSFESLARITSFVSPVGNNDVPYPYCIDKYGNYYLLIDDTVIKNRADEILLCDNPYNYFYERYVITPSRGKVTKPFRNIDKFYAGTRRTSLTYTPYPERESFTGHSMYVVMRLSRGIGGIKKKITREEYIDLIEEFGAEENFEPIKGKRLLQERL